MAVANTTDRRATAVEYKITEPEIKGEKGDRDDVKRGLQDEYGYA